MHEDESCAVMMREVVLWVILQRHLFFDIVTLCPKSTFGLTPLVSQHTVDSLYSVYEVYRVENTRDHSGTCSASRGTFFDEMKVL